MTYRATLTFDREVSFSKYHQFLLIPQVSFNHYWNQYSHCSHSIRWGYLNIGWTTQGVFMPGLFQIKKLIYNRYIKLYIQPSWGFAAKYLAVHIYLHYKNKVYKWQIF